MDEATKHVVKPMEEYEVAELSAQISKFLELNLDIKIADFRVKRIDGLYVSGADALALPDEHIIYIDSSFILKEAENAVEKMRGEIDIESTYKAMMIKILAHEIMQMVPTYIKDEMMANYIGTIIAFFLTDDPKIILTALKITGIANLGNDLDLAKYVIGGQKAYETISDMRGDREEIMIVAKSIVLIPARSTNSDTEDYI